MEKIEKYKEDIVILAIVLVANLAMYFDIYSKSYGLLAQVINCSALAYYIYKNLKTRRLDK